MLRRSARKSYIVAACLAVAIAGAAYVASSPIWGRSLPQYPSAPYAALPALLAIVVLTMWLSTRSWVYTLDGNAAVVQWGLLSHHRYGVPLRTIASLELKQSPIERLLGVGTIEMAARDTHGREQRVLMEDVANPRETYEELVRLVGKSLRTRPATQSS